MLSYHNDIEVKNKYVERFAKHRELDEVIQGTGFHNGRGCFVGCTLDSYEHSRFPDELGWPEWLAHLADNIFECLSKEEAPQFGADLLGAVPVGVDLENLRHIIAIKRLESVTENCKYYKNINDLKKVINKVIDCHKSELSGASCDWNAANAEMNAEMNKKCAARSALWNEECAAWSAALSVANAVRSGKSVSLAMSAAWKKERDDLLDAIKSLNS